ncbi:hypothetical protein GWI72_13610 [Microvirga tunisiensis]|uniref:Uncharacterized protein n=2 Tax=Pannonibacter tanglangensis TaxID=2750084 RepID=A0A7X5F3X9_9HYPH|nr:MULTISPECIES: luciferase family protein [unclassified Pannonibacter]NBN64807.1 hypothetical protein [Pannonibacter sp. XCT-34]NBN79308.1 hypothetical protein [Pannonibacter sp. XCT-53]
MTGLRHKAGARALPFREGPPPRYTLSNPQTQLDQQPDRPLTFAIVSEVSGWPGVRIDGSLRAPMGTVGFFLDHPSGQPADSFLLGLEFAHVHPGPDHSLHMVLPEPILSEAIGHGWAVPHHLAGAPGVSRFTVLVFAPRDTSELPIALALVKSAWHFAAGI